jgi:hypothetical protein
MHVTLCGDELGGNRTTKNNIIMHIEKHHRKELDLCKKDKNYWPTTRTLDGQTTLDLKLVGSWSMRDNEVFPEVVEDLLLRWIISDEQSFAVGL